MSKMPKGGGGRFDPIRVFLVYFGGFFLYFSEKMPDNFQNKAGGQPLFGKSLKENYPDLRVSA